MHQFIFWANIESPTINATAALAHLSNSSSNKVGRIDTTRCSLIYSLRQPRACTIQQNDTLLYSSPFLRYDGESGEAALKHALQDSLTHTKPQPNRCQGHGALLHYNSQHSTLNVSTDKFGNQPVYYTQYNHGIIVSSSLSLLVQTLPAVPALSDQAIYHYIDLHVIPSPLTIYKNIYKLEPAQSLRFNGKLELETHWQPDFVEHPQQSIPELQQAIRDALRQGVINCNLNQDAASFLSGGLDSSTISGLLAQTSDKQVANYSIGFEEAGYDEMEFAQLASRHFDTQLKSLYVTPNDVASAFSKVVNCFDEPFGNSSAIPAYYCAKFAADDGVKTMLAGDGGDELFAGNERYAKQFVFEHYQKLPKALRTGLLQPLLLKNNGFTNTFPFSKLKSYIEQAITPMPDRMQRYSFINYFQTASIFKADFLQQINTELPNQQKREVYDRPGNASMLNRMLYMDWKFTLADNDLIKVNKTSQLAGINVHYPMLDDAVVDISTQIPSIEKLKGKNLRHFYKQSFGNFLPEQIINKSKHGFGLPFGEWLKKSPEMQEHIYDNLSTLKQYPFIQAEFIDHIIHIHRTQKATSYYGTMVWILAVLQEWLASRRL